MIHYAQQVEKKKDSRSMFKKLKNMAAGGGEISIEFEGQTKDAPQIVLDDPFERVRDRLPLQRGDEAIEGQVVIRAGPAKHLGIKIELVGMLTVFGDAVMDFEFHSEEELQSAGQLDPHAETRIPFCFKDLKKCDSYRGVMGKVSYRVRAALIRNISSLKTEREIWIVSPVCERVGFSIRPRTSSTIKKESVAEHKNTGLPTGMQRMRFAVSMKNKMDENESEQGKGVENEKEDDYEKPQTSLSPISEAALQGPAADAPHMMIGIRNKLHMEVFLEGDIFSMTSVLHGVIYFLLTEVPLCYCELRIVRFEKFRDPTTQEVKTEEHTMQTYEVMDGTPCDREEALIRFPFACVPFLSPTYPDLANVFSVEYSIKLMFLTINGRRLFKDIPITIFREATTSAAAALESGQLGSTTALLTIPVSSTCVTDMITTRD